MATSSASLDSSPRSNWVEETAKDGLGGLPKGIRKVARALKKRYPAWSMSRCIATAKSMSVKWAAGGSAKGAKNVAEWEALRARNKARQVATANLGDGTAVELASDEHGRVIELARYVRTAEGARRYGKPIGTLLDGSTRTDRMAGPALPRAMRQERVGAARLRGQSDAALRKRRDAVVAEHKAGKGTAPVAEQRRRLAEAREIDTELKRRAGGGQAKQVDRTGAAANLRERTEAKKVERSEKAARKPAAAPKPATAAGEAEKPSGPSERVQGYLRAPAEQRAALVRDMDDAELQQLDGAMGRALEQAPSAEVRKAIEARRAPVTAEQARRTSTSKPVAKPESKPKPGAAPARSGVGTTATTADRLARVDDPRAEAGKLTDEQLRAVDREMAFRATALGKAGQVSKAHKAVRDERERRGSGRREQPQQQAAQADAPGKSDGDRLSRLTPQQREAVLAARAKRRAATPPATEKRTPQQQAEDAARAARAGGGTDKDAGKAFAAQMSKNVDARRAEREKAEQDRKTPTEKATPPVKPATFLKDEHAALFNAADIPAAKPGSVFAVQTGQAIGMQKAIKTGKVHFVNASTGAVSSERQPGKQYLANPDGTLSIDYGSGTVHRVPEVKARNAAKTGLAALAENGRAGKRGDVGKIGRDEHPARTAVADKPRPSTEEVTAPDLSGIPEGRRRDLVESLLVGKRATSEAEAGRQMQMRRSRVHGIDDDDDLRQLEKDLAALKLPAGGRDDPKQDRRLNVRAESVRDLVRRELADREKNGGSARQKLQAQIERARAAGEDVPGGDIRNWTGKKSTPKTSTVPERYRDGGPREALARKRMDADTERRETTARVLRNAATTRAEAEKGRPLHQDTLDRAKARQDAAAKAGREYKERRAASKPATPAETRKLTVDGAQDLSDLQKLTDRQLDAERTAARERMAKIKARDPKRSSQAYSDAKLAVDVIAAETRRRTAAAPVPARKLQDRRDNNRWKRNLGDRSTPGTAENVQARQDAQGAANRKAAPGLFPEDRPIPKGDGSLFDDPGESAGKTAAAGRAAKAAAAAGDAPALSRALGDMGIPANLGGENRAVLAQQLVALHRDNPARAQQRIDRLREANTKDSELVRERQAAAKASAPKTSAPSGPPSAESVAAERVAGMKAAERRKALAAMSDDELQKLKASSEERQKRVTRLNTRAAISTNRELGALNTDIAKLLAARKDGTARRSTREGALVQRSRADVEQRRKLGIKTLSNTGDRSVELAGAVAAALRSREHRTEHRRAGRQERADAFVAAMRLDRD